MPETIWPSKQKIFTIWPFITLGLLEVLLLIDLEPQQLSQDKARVRGSPSCLLYIFAVAAKVWESLFSLLTGEFEARYEVGGFVPSIRNRVTLISLVNSIGR